MGDALMIVDHLDLEGSPKSDEIKQHIAAMLKESAEDPTMQDANPKDLVKEKLNKLIENHTETKNDNTHLLNAVKTRLPETALLNGRISNLEKLLEENDSYITDLQKASDNLKEI